MERCEVCGANLQLVGLRHRCVPRASVTETVTGRDESVTGRYGSVTVSDESVTAPQDPKGRYRARTHREKLRLRREWHCEEDGWWPWVRMRGE